MTSQSCLHWRAAFKSFGNVGAKKTVEATFRLKTHDKHVQTVIAMYCLFRPWTQVGWSKCALDYTQQQQCYNNAWQTQAHVASRHMNIWRVYFMAAPNIKFPSSAGVKVFQGLVCEPWLLHSFYAQASNLLIEKPMPCLLTTNAAFSKCYGNPPFKNTQLIPANMAGIMAACGYNWAGEATRRGSRRGMKGDGPQFISC